MRNTVNTEFELAPFSFLALMASEGQVPNVKSGSTDKEIFAVAVEEAVREVASDLTAKGDFFSLMTENGQMAATAPAKKYNVKIVRPTHLGGGFGGSFGGGALAH